MFSPIARVHVCLWMFYLLLPGSDATFSFSKEPSNPTIVVFGVNSSRVALSWVYNLSDGETIVIMRLERLNNSNSASELVAGRIGASSSGNVHEKFNKDGHFEFEDPSTLVINNVTTADEFVYRCVVQTSVDIAGHKSDMKLEVYIPPTIIDRPKDKVVYDMGNVRFYCAALGKPPASIKWSKDGTDVGSGAYYNETAIQVGTYVYRCTADNGFGEPDSASATLTVKSYVLSNLTMEPFNKTLNVKAGTPLFLRCDADADPEPEWTWSKDDGVIQSDGNVLKRDDLDTRDAGSYTCTARNPKGEDSVTQYIIVLENSGKKIKVGVSLKITNKEWNSKYEDLESHESDGFKQAILPELWIVYRQKFTSVVRIEIFKLSEGSVVAHVRLTFDEEVSVSDVIAVLKNDEDGRLGNLIFDKTSVKSISPVDPASRCSPNPCEHGGECANGKCSCAFPWQGEHCSDPTIIIVLAVVIPVVFVLLVFLVLFWRNRKRKCRKDTRVDDGETKVSYAKRGPLPADDGGYAAVQTGAPDQYENLKKGRASGTVDPPTYASVQKSERNNEQVAPDEYAVVEKNKKKKKRVPGDLNYADMSDSNPRHGAMPPVKPRRQEQTQYADIAFKKSRGNDDML